MNEVKPSIIFFAVIFNFMLSNHLDTCVIFHMNSKSVRVGSINNAILYPLLYPAQGFTYATSSSTFVIV